MKVVPENDLLLCEILGKEEYAQLWRVVEHV
jgi:hypothetical protein